jgi:hypothetical protein
MKRMNELPTLFKSKSNSKETHLDQVASLGAAPRGGAGLPFYKSPLMLQTLRSLNPTRIEHDPLKIYHSSLIDWLHSHSFTRMRMN